MITQKNQINKCLQKYSNSHCSSKAEVGQRKYNWLTSSLLHTLWQNVQNLTIGKFIKWRTPTHIQGVWSHLGVYLREQVGICWHCCPDSEGGHKGCQKEWPVLSGKSEDPPDADVDLDWLSFLFWWNSALLRIIRMIRILYFIEPWGSKYFFGAEADNAGWPAGIALNRSSPLPLGEDNGRTSSAHAIHPTSAPVIFIG